MATSQSFLDFVCEQLEGVGAIRPFRMMGEGMVYVDEKPVVLICDDTVYIKKLPALDKFGIKETGIPYIRLTRATDKITHVLYWELESPEVHAALCQPALEKFYKRWTRCLTTMPKIILGESVI